MGRTIAKNRAVLDMPLPSLSLVLTLSDYVSDFYTCAVMPLTGKPTSRAPELCAYSILVFISASLAASAVGSAEVELVFSDTIWKST